VGSHNCDPHSIGVKWWTVIFVTHISSVWNMSNHHFGPHFIGVKWWAVIFVVTVSSVWNSGQPSL
jgi:hypothetical protein